MYLDLFILSQERDRMDEINEQEFQRQEAELLLRLDVLVNEEEQPWLPLNKFRKPPSSF